MNEAGYRVLWALIEKEYIEKIGSPSVIIK